MDLPVGDDAPKGRIPLTIPLRDHKSLRESGGRIFHRAFKANCKYNRSRALSQHREVAFNTTWAITFDTKCTQLENGSKTVMPIYIFAMRHESLLSFKTFISMNDSFAFDGNFAQRV